MNPRPHTSRRPILFAAVLSVVAAVGVTAFAAPRNGAPDQPAPDLRRTLFEQRSREAESKASTVEAYLQAQLAATPNQALYDVYAYDLTFTLVPTTQMLTGVAVIRAEALAPISTMDLNLHTKMSVASVTAGGGPVAFSHPATHILTITLDRTYDTGETIEVSVSYSGNPGGVAFRWTSWGGRTLIWTLSEPYGAREWWPCKDLNTDKADSLDLHVTVPDNLIVGSNGLLVSDVDHGTTRTFHWRSRYPIAPYLVSLAVYPYATYSHWYTPIAGGAPMEVKYYVFPEHFSSVAPTYALTVPMIETFAAGFGEYPFVNEKYGHAEFDWGGAMEHQTLSSMGTWAADVIAHELAHQWYGDLITCADFGHIWLNEGFATWAEAYWHEQQEGPAAYREMMGAATYYGPGTIFVEDPLNDNIFDVNLSYNKGSWVVHMLRGVVGDAAFFAGLADYRAQYGFGAATTEQFRDVMEAASGVDLDAFFQQWIYGAYMPVYRTTWAQTAGTLEMTIEQIQTNTGLFTMPIQVRITTTTGITDFTVQNSLASEVYAIPVTGTVTGVTLDPDDWLLNLEEQFVVNPTFHRGILLVNGVSWEAYGTEITTAYENRAFWGDFDITFWDVFAEPAGGYPSTLPAPIGQGAVPVDVLKQFSTVIWAGNNLGGDLERWKETAIKPYLEAGGNVLLMSRMGRDFLDPDLTPLAGVTWAARVPYGPSCIAAYPGLVNMAVLGQQNFNDVFYPSIAPDAHLLFRYSDSSRGIGVHRQIPGGGPYRPTGGHLVYIAGRPYRFIYGSLRANVEFILGHFMSEPYSAVAAGEPAIRAPLELRSASPNPFASRTTIGFTLARPGPARLGVYDAAGRLVRTLANGDRAAGTHEITWDATDGAGRAVAPGTYFMRLEAAGTARTRSVVMLR